MLLLVCRRHQRNQLLEVNRHNYANIDNQQHHGNVEVNPDEGDDEDDQGELQPLVVPAEEEQEPVEEDQEPVEEEDQPAEQHCQIL